MGFKNPREGFLVHIAVHAQVVAQWRPWNHLVDVVELHISPRAQLVQDLTSHAHNDGTQGTPPPTATGGGKHLRKPCGACFGCRRHEDVAGPHGEGQRLLDAGCAVRLD